MKYYSAITTLILVSLTLVSCNQNATITDNPDPANNPDIPKICEIISEEHLTSILDDNFSMHPVDFLDEKVEGCKYIATTNDEEDAKNINFIVIPADNEAQAKAEFYKAVSVWQNSGIENRDNEYLDSIGTDAFLSIGTKNAQLITYNESTVLILTLGNFKEENDLIKQKALSTGTEILLALPSFQ